MGILSGGFCPRGILSRGILSGGFCPGGLSWGILSYNHYGYYALKNFSFFVSD